MWVHGIYFTDEGDTGDKKFENHRFRCYLKTPSTMFIFKKYLATLEP